MTPCIVITRDRVRYTRACLISLGAQPDLDIHLVDHGSTWEPMLDFLEGCPYPVHKQGDLSPRALWDWDGLKNIVKEKQYLVTDPDLVLDSACPVDWLQWLQRALDTGSYVKTGLGLRIDDLPSTVQGTKIQTWEKQFHTTPDVAGYGFRAPVDTTLALYPPLNMQPKFDLGPALRLAPPYQVRHLPWYEDLTDEENMYYREHLVPGSSHWINGG